MLTQEQLLRELRPSIDRWSRILSRHHARQQDLAQEAWIAAWRYFTKDPTKEVTWYRSVAITRMRQLQGKRPGPMFGQPHRADGAVTQEVSVDVLEWQEHFGFVEEQLEQAYHDGEVGTAIEELVKAAVSTLTPRQQEYIQKRFFEGYTATELVNEFGTTGGGLWHTKSGAKEKLRKYLEGEQ